MTRNRRSTADTSTIVEVLVPMDRSVMMMVSDNDQVHPKAATTTAANATGPEETKFFPRHFAGSGGGVLGEEDTAVVAKSS
jgi:hypothetical protein